MSSVPSAPPLRLNLRPSRYLICVLGLFHLLALVSVAVCDLPWWVTVPLGLAVLVSLAISIACHGLRSRWFIEEIVRTVDGEWRLHTADGQERSARLLASYVHPHIKILKFSLGQFVRRSIILLADSADPEEIRRLRVCLMTAKQEEK